MTQDVPEFQHKVRLLPLTRDQAPGWSMTLDPHTGSGVFSFDPEFLIDRRGIAHFVSVLEMHLHNMSRQLAEVGK
jgi:hypothetical protein